MKPPTTENLSLKWISINFPNLELLLFLVVLALPKASKTGLAGNKQKKYQNCKINFIFASNQIHWQNNSKTHYWRDN